MKTEPVSSISTGRGILERESWELERESEGFRFFFLSEEDVWGLVVNERERGG